MPQQMARTMVVWQRGGRGAILTVNVPGESSPPGVPMGPGFY
jgi:hypothetical protein